MQDGGDADARAKVLGVCRDGTHGLGRGLEQQIIDHGFVVIGEVAIRGHVFCSFLALVLKTALEERIAALGRSGSWPEIIADLDSLTETEIAYDGKGFIVRSPPRLAASLALRATGVALPPTVRDAAAS